MVNEIKMEIARDINSHALSSVKIIMPTWNKVKDNIIYINLPFLGLETCARDEEDAEIAVREAVECFCIIAEKHGLGLESELEFVGWEKVENDSVNSFMNITPKFELFDSLINTGEQQALQLTLVA